MEFSNLFSIAHCCFKDFALFKEPNKTRAFAVSSLPTVLARLIQLYEPVKTSLPSSGSRQAGLARSSDERNFKKILKEYMRRDLGKAT